MSFMDQIMLAGGFTSGSFPVEQYAGAWAVEPNWLTSESDGTTTVNDQRDGLGDDRDRQPGMALTFDGTQSTQGTAEEELDITGWSTFYFSVWFQTSTLGQLFIFAVRHTGADDLRFWVSAGDAQCQLDDGTINGTVSGGSGYNDGQWHRMVVTFDGTTIDLVIYDAAGNVEATDRRGGSFDFATADGLAKIGNRPNGGSFQWVGELYDLRFGQSEDNLEMHYKLEDNSTEDALDSSGNGHHALLINAPVAYKGADVPGSYANDVGRSVLRNHVPHTTGDWPQSITEWRLSGDAVATAGQADPYGGTEALLLDHPTNAENDYLYVSCNRTPALATTTYTASAWIKQGTRTKCQITIDDNSFAGDRYQVSYDWSTGLTTESGTKAKGGVTLDHGVAETLGDWVRIYITFTTWPITGGSGDFQFMVRGGTTGTAYWFCPQIVLGTEVTETQRNYNALVGTVIPRDESDTTKDAFGNDLQYTGQAPNDGQALAHSVLQLDGTQYIPLTDPVTLTGDFVLSWWMKHDVFSNRTIFCSDLTSSIYIRIASTTTIRFTINSSFIVLTVPDITVQLKKYTLRRVGNRLSIDVNGVEEDSFIGASLLDFRIGLIGVRESLTEYFSGDLALIVMIDGDGTKLLDIPCCTGVPGTNSAFVTERVSETTLAITNAADNWAKSDYGPHVNMEQGFSAAHNEVLSSNDFATNWFAIGGVGNVLETDYADGPDVPNVGRASRLTLAQSSGTYFPYRDHTSSGGTYTLSCWAKKTPGSVSPQFSFFKSSGGTTWSTPITTTDEWVRYSWTVSITAGTNELGINNADDSFATDILIAGFQVTPTATVVPYYPTTDTLFYSGTRIPASLTNPALDALGNTLTNPPQVGNNDSESALVFTKNVNDPANYNKDVPGVGTLAAAEFDGDYGDVTVGVDTASREGEFSLEV